MSNDDPRKASEFGLPDEMQPVVDELLKRMASADPADEPKSEFDRLKAQKDAIMERKTQELSRAAGHQPEPPVRMWVLETPFNKRGVPVMGTFGSRSGNVVIFTVSEWKRLCDAVPQLQTMQFEVGSYD